jgi:hypothetical protein
VFKITKHRGFQITFENGWTVSVQFGGGMYCKNYDRDCGSEQKINILKCQDAEIAAFDDNGEMLEFLDGDTVKGYVSPNETLEFMNKIAGMKK